MLVSVTIRIKGSRETECCLSILTVKTVAAVVQVCYVVGEGSDSEKVVLVMAAAAVLTNQRLAGLSSSAKAVDHPGMVESLAARWERALEKVVA